MAVTNMKINGISCPVGYDCERLLLSWQVENSQGKKPVNARIQVWNNDALLLVKGVPPAGEGDGLHPSRLAPFHL